MLKNFGVAIIYILTISLSGLTGLVPVVHAAVTDLVPPIVRHSPPTRITHGEKMVIMAIVEDESDISLVNLWYKAPGKGTYTRIRMEQGDSKTYQISIEVTKGFKEGIEYYIEATDQFGNVGTDGNKAMPYYVGISELPDIPRLAKEDKPDVKISKRAWWRNPWFWVGVVVLGGAATAVAGNGGAESNSGTGIIIVE